MRLLSSKLSSEYTVEYAERNSKLISLKELSYSLSHSTQLRLFCQNRTYTNYVNKQAISLTAAFVFVSLLCHSLNNAIQFITQLWFHFKNNVTDTI